MKNKGFTLIELLAVIVVLAVIALIATPIVLNLVEKSRVGAAEQSATAYVKAVENGIMAKLIEDPSATVKGTFTVNSDGTKIVNSSGTEIDVDVKGDKPKAGGTIVIGDNGSVETAYLTINKYSVTYQEGESKVNSDEYKIELTQEDYENSANGLMSIIEEKLATIENINEYTKISGSVAIGTLEYGDYELYLGDNEEVLYGLKLYNLYPPSEYSFTIQNGKIKDGSIIFDIGYYPDNEWKVMLVNDGQLDKTVYTSIHADATQTDKELMVNDLIDALENYLATDENVNNYTKIQGRSVINYSQSSYAPRTVSIYGRTIEQVEYPKTYPKIGQFTFEGHKAMFDYYNFTVENGKIKDGSVNLSHDSDVIEVSNGQIVK